MLTSLGIDGLIPGATGYNNFHPQLEELDLEMQLVVTSDCCLHSSPEAAS